MKVSLIHPWTISLLLMLSVGGLRAQENRSSASSGMHHKTTATKKRSSDPDQLLLLEQIRELRQQLLEQSRQIEELRSGLSAKDQQLQQTNERAGQAQQDIVKLSARLQMQLKEDSENGSAVQVLSKAVSDLRGTQTALATTVSNDTALIKQSIEQPSTLHYKQITFTPSGFFAAESVFRNRATGGELATPFNALPFEGADSYSLSEIFLSARQSRMGLLAEGKTAWGTLRGYIEGDFLGVGTSSNDNQSTSYMFRQRLIYGEVQTTHHWLFSGGQMWSLATENKKGISTAPSSIALPLQVDPNYIPGLVWARSGQFRVTRNFSRASLAASIENPQLLYSASLAGTTPYAVIGSAGANGGLMNAAVGGCSPTTSVVNYTNQVDGGISTAVPVYKTLTSCANLANISFNKAPDLLVKVTFDPRLGHLELFGIGRFAHETVYPGETTDSNLYGGNRDVTTGAIVAPALTTSGAYQKSITLGGIGGSVRTAMVSDRLTLGVKVLIGLGVGHFGDSTLPDVTSNARGALAPIHNSSGLFTSEFKPTHRLQLYANYGGDYAGRADYSNASSTSLGAPVADFCISGTTNCTTTPTAAQMAQGGTWGAHWATPSQAAVGYGSRFLSNASCLSTATPGFNGGSTGFYSGGSCGAQTRSVQEATGGFWYDFYKGDRGRLTEGFQYGYTVREGWSGALGVGAKGIDNMFYTSFRYYLP